MRRESSTYLWDDIPKDDLESEFRSEGLSTLAGLDTRSASLHHPRRRRQRPPFLQLLLRYGLIVAACGFALFQLGKLLRG